jgi:DNA-binding NarL/FixJ family response regulator
MTNSQTAVVFNKRDESPTRKRITIQLRSYDENGKYNKELELYKTYIPTLPQKTQVVAKMIFEGNEVSDIAKKLRVTKSQLMKMFGADHDSQYGRLTENNTVK